MKDLTDHEKQTVWNALRIAAERFDENAKACGDAKTGLPKRHREALRAQFERQAADARQLLERFE